MTAEESDAAIEEAEQWARENPVQAAKLEKLGAKRNGVPINAPPGEAGVRARRNAARAIPMLAVVIALVGVLLAGTWLYLGGIPADHGRYGQVAIPGSGTIQLAKGDVRLYYERNSFGKQPGAPLPTGLEVTVRAAGGGDQLTVRRLSGHVLGFGSGDREVEPYGQIDVRSAGAYSVDTTASGPIPADSLPAITFGASPWRPFGSVLLGFVLILAIFGGAALWLTRWLRA